MEKEGMHLGTIQNLSQVRFMGYQYIYVSSQTKIKNIKNKISKKKQLQSYGSDEIK